MQIQNICKNKYRSNNSKAKVMTINSGSTNLAKICDRMKSKN